MRLVFESQESSVAFFRERKRVYRGWKGGGGGRGGGERERLVVGGESERKGKERDVAGEKKEKGSVLLTKWREKCVSPRYRLISKAFSTIGNPR